MISKKENYIIIIMIVILIFMIVNINDYYKYEKLKIEYENKVLDYDSYIQYLYEEMENMEEENPRYHGDYYVLSDLERQTVLRVMASECRGSSLETCFCVAESIRDRAITRNQDILDVLYAPNQYAKPYSGHLSDKVEDKLNRAIDMVFKEGLYYDDNNYIIHFHDTSVTPNWSNDFIKICQIGNMIFYN